MPPRLVFLAGGPAQDALTWHEEQLASAFVPPLRRFLGEEVPINPSAVTQTSQLLPKWRHVSLNPQRLQAEKQPAIDLEATQFLSFHDDGILDDEQDHMDFFEHSLAVLQSLESSQIEVPEATRSHEDTTSFDVTFSTDPSLHTSSESLSAYLSEAPDQQVVSFNSPLTDLKQIPNAKHLLSIHPQTITINIIASVIIIQPPRTVRVRARNAEMDIIEILLGDETKAGFSISFWLPPSAATGGPVFPTPHDSNLRSTLRTLRSGDVLLLTHIALSQFRGNVYGQSLSRRRSSRNNNTTVTVLSDHQVVGLNDSAAAKMGRVRAWSRDFVVRKRALSSSSGRGDGKKHRAADELPPETQ